MLDIRNNNPIAALPPPPPLAQPAELFKGEQEAEVLDFLSAQPLLTFVMTGWIKDNGLVSPLNRGSFYGTRNSHGQINGVALIGHVTTFETNSDSALCAFAALSKKCQDTFVVMGEEQKVNRFLGFYSPEAGSSDRVSRQLLFEQRSRQDTKAPVPNLRRATCEEVGLVVPVHAQIAFEQTGVNPLNVDPDGFRKRCARRIQQGRVWVCVEDQRLLFKADVISDFPDINYLEGVYVTPESRGKGLGTACMRQLTNVLLAHTKSVCLMTEETEAISQACYLKAGYKLREYYKTIFVESESSDADN